MNLFEKQAGPAPEAPKPEAPEAPDHDDKMADIIGQVTTKLSEITALLGQLIPKETETD